MRRREFLKAATAALAVQLGTGKSRAENLQMAKTGNAMGLRPVDLRCEYAVDPWGIEVAQPRLQWILQSTSPGARSQRQIAYRILVATSRARLQSGKADLWNPGKIQSGTSIQVQYAGKPLGSRQSVWWKVKIWDQDGRPSSWSEPAVWHMGLLKSDDWTGKWIGMDGGEEEPEEFQGASWISNSTSAPRPLWFRRLFEIAEANPSSFGLLVAQGSGEIAAFVNGTRVAAPPKENPNDYAAQDIAQIIHPGRNVIAVKVAPNSSQTALLAGVTLELADGEIRHIQTDATWKVSDAEQTGWERLEFNDATWQAATTNTDLPIPKIRGERTRLPARMLRREFGLTSAPRKATVYLSGLGYHELYLNGEKVGEDVLSPGLTDYEKRVFYIARDVTELLRPGRNAIGILLGNGRFYAPRHNLPTFTRTFGFPKALLQLEVEDDNGQRVTVVTDSDWKITTNGPIRANNYYDGEEYDARMEQAGWASPGFDARQWDAAKIVDAPAGALHAQASDPIRVMQDIKPVRITQPRPGIYVFDMGQNMVGWCRLHVSGTAGTCITMRHAETLRPDGMLYTDNLRSARQKDIYFLKGTDAEVYEPRFTSHGFRYVELRGFPGTPSLDVLIGRVVHDAMAEHADFTTSDDVINHVYRNMLWGDRGNYQSVPTDCPQRDERQGWLGDRSAESKGESYLFDVSRFYPQWVQNMEDTMDTAGRINDVAPAYWPFYNENVVWPASFFIVPAMLLRQYGDETVIRKHYPAMKRWIGHMQPFIQGDLMPVDVYGDWCVPPKSLTLIHSDDPNTKTAAEILGSTYFYFLLQLMSQFAVISHHPEDRQDYDALASRMKTAFNAKYFKPDKNEYDNGTQTSSVLALALGLAPEERRQAICDVLVRKIEVDSSGHVGTGLVGSQWLMQTLTGGGRPDVACQIASQTTYPSWGYMIHRGATTIWELWNGDTANPAMNSRNHLMLLGDFSTWLYEDLAGIQSDLDQSGFKHIIVYPKISCGLKFVRASHNSPYGRIATEWSRNGNRFALRVSIPPNTTATVHVATSDPASVEESGTGVTQSSGVSFLRAEPNVAIYEIGSGEYAFASTL